LTDELAADFDEFEFSVNHFRINQLNPQNTHFYSQVSIERAFKITPKGAKVRLFIRLIYIEP